MRHNHLKYLTWFEPHQGKTDTDQSPEEDDYGLCEEEYGVPTVKYVVKYNFVEFGTNRTATKMFSFPKTNHRATKTFKTNHTATKQFFLSKDKSYSNKNVFLSKDKSYSIENVFPLTLKNYTLPRTLQLASHNTVCYKSRHLCRRAAKTYSRCETRGLGDEYAWRSIYSTPHIL